MGDVLMCTPALRELKRKNPRCYVRFYTDFETLVRGLSYIDEVLSFDERPKEMINLQYEDAIPPQAHLAQIMGDNLGFTVCDVRPDCVIKREAAMRFNTDYLKLGHPRIVIQRRSSLWTRNKDWPDGCWVELIERLSEQAGIIEIGKEISIQENSFQNYIDLRGQTSVEELVAVIASADAIVGPPSGPLHVAAAAGIPAVEIIGGYEHPVNTSYTRNISLYTSLDCSPCWLREPCPYGLKCLRSITPGAVEKAIWAVLGQQSDTSRFNKVS